MKVARNKVADVEYTDCLALTICNDLPFPVGFHKLAIVHPGKGNVSLSQFIVVAQSGPLTGVDRLDNDYWRFIPVLSGQTVGEWMAENRPDMRLLSTRPIRR